MPLLYTAKEMRERELFLKEQGYKLVVGTDEAGRGPLAGPVVAGACYVPEHVVIPGIGDSKALNEEKREELYEILVNHPEVKWGVSILSNKVIDKINILNAAMLAMVRSVEDLATKFGSNPDYVLVDGNRNPPFAENGLDIENEPVIKGDAKCYCIAAASIIAKVTRDRIMVKLDKEYPGYDLAKHKGYATKGHQATVLKLGATEIHRKSFAPIKTMKGIDLTGTYLDPMLPENIAKRKKAEELKRKREGREKERKGEGSILDFFGNKKKKKRSKKFKKMTKGLKRLVEKHNSTKGGNKRKNSSSRSRSQPKKGRKSWAETKKKSKRKRSTSVTMSSGKESSAKKAKRTKKGGSESEKETKGKKAKDTKRKRSTSRSASSVKEQPKKKAKKKTKTRKPAPKRKRTKRGSKKSKKKGTSSAGQTGQTDRTESDFSRSRSRNRPPKRTR